MKLNRILAGATAFVLALGLLAGTAAAAGKPAPTGKVNLNSASVESRRAGQDPIELHGFSPS